MIAGIGIDTVEVARFAEWHLMPRTSLARIFSPEEIDYCLQASGLSAPRFAARFAAREAFFKALQGVHPTAALPFLTVCRALKVAKGPNNAPFLQVNWSFLQHKKPDLKPLAALISLTDTASMATAIVALTISA